MPGQKNVQGTRGYVPVAALNGGPFRLDDIDPNCVVTLWVNDGFLWAPTRVQVPADTEVPCEVRPHYGGAMRLRGVTAPDGVTVHLEPVGHDAVECERYVTAGQPRIYFYRLIFDPASGAELTAVGIRQGGRAESLGPTPQQLAHGRRVVPSPRVASRANARGTSRGPPTDLRANVHGRGAS